MGRLLEFKSTIHHNNPEPVQCKRLLDPEILYPVGCITLAAANLVAWSVCLYLAWEAIWGKN